MTDFTLTPDAPELPDTPARSVRLVATGLAPTAELPAPRRKTPELPPCYAPCPRCGDRVLTGTTREGTVLALDTQSATYTVVYGSGEPQPLFAPSRAYPVHGCAHRAGMPPAPTGAP
jgi:hypothetical protein